MPKHKKPRQTALFDIRITSLDSDVLVLKGPPSEAPSAMLSGVVVLSVLEPMAIKRLNLKLYANLKLRWTESFQGSRGIVSRPMRYNRRMFDFEWDPLNLADYFRGSANSMFDGTMPSLTTGKISRSNNSSSASLNNLAKRSKSSTSMASFANLSSLGGGSKTDSYILQKGNYEFPFSTILEGSIPESIEGLPGCSLVYKMQAVIERDRSHPSLLTTKHIRVVRTLSSDAPELSESVAVDNTWPKKVDYSISVPTRASAIGSRCNIELLMVPLLKGLRLGNVKIQLVELYSYCGTLGSHTAERTVQEKVLKRVTNNDDGKDIWTEVEPNIDGQFFNNGEISLSMDKWQVNTFLQLLPSLAVQTQDCDVENFVKVRHKLKFGIGLVNPDGHVSELRATLPVSLFVSPFVAVVAKHDVEEESGKVVNVEDVTVAIDQDEDILFSADHDFSASSENIGSAVNTQDLMAPPNYQDHIYDRLWSEVQSPVDSPTNSGSATPTVLENLSTSLPNGSSASLAIAAHKLRGVAHVGEFNMSPADSSRFSSQLLENLTRLHSQREGSSSASLERSARTPNRPTFSLSDDQEVDYFSYGGSSSSDHHAQQQQSTQPQIGGFSMSRGSTPGASLPPPLMSPNIYSPVQHLSRVNSTANFGDTSTGTHSPSHWDTTTLSRVPSYNAALKSSSANPVNELTPSYEPGPQQLNIDYLDHKLRQTQLDEDRAAHASTSPVRQSINRGALIGTQTGSSRTRESHILSADLAKSRGSSSNSSPAISRNQSTSNVLAMSMSMTKVVPTSKKSASASTSHSSSASPHLTAQDGSETESTAGLPLLASSDSRTTFSSTQTTENNMVLPKAAHIHSPTSMTPIGYTEAPRLTSQKTSGSISSANPKLRPVLGSKHSFSSPKKTGSFASLSHLLHRKEGNK
ncbi:unnamed protein product [Kuraishia capsulata CBS 1993]|uniref:Arrestin C-terminal-like domain-containing protein n=1 Tax=Kuraishia capsulata CBS 1993 TaxID=1382522 RepID=W6MGZ0_9ASCO|nr:uncharacterized protein KUCA_T00001143001 [Kuraishia capsulata CBS 1993]CDK25176.1 unnamed protein product [Kuraishia capsulata CBS 1993]